MAVLILFYGQACMFSTSRFFQFPKNIFQKTINKRRRQRENNQNKVESRTYLSMSLLIQTNVLFWSLSAAIYIFLGY